MENKNKKEVKKAPVKSVICDEELHYRDLVDVSYIWATGPIVAWNWQQPLLLAVSSLADVEVVQNIVCPCRGAGKQRRKQLRR